MMRIRASLNVNFVQIEGRTLRVEAGLVEQLGSRGFLPRTTLPCAGFLLWRLHVLLQDAALHTRSVDGLLLLLLVLVLMLVLLLGLGRKWLRFPVRLRVRVMVDAGIVDARAGGVVAVHESGAVDGAGRGEAVETLLGRGAPAVGLGDGHGASVVVAVRRGGSTVEPLRRDSVSAGGMLFWWRVRPATATRVVLRRRASTVAWGESTSVVLGR